MEGKYDYQQVLKWVFSPRMCSKFNYIYAFPLC